jgi:ABC-2 type transport system ATP-binding protein
MAHATVGAGADTTTVPVDHSDAHGECLADMATGRSACAARGHPRTVVGMNHSPAPTAGIVARHLTKSFGERPVLRGVDLAVAPGEIVGLIGPNGIGKSTSLRIIAGVDRPDGGELSIAGIDAVAQPTDARWNIGYLPDVGGLLPRLTVTEHLELQARLRNLGRGWTTRADELIERLDLGDHRHTAAANLSHGLSRRCGLAVALLARPPVLLVDEPFDGVDPKAGRAVRQLLEDAAGEGAAVVCSTHLLNIAGQLCHRVALMYDGVVVVTDTPDQLAGGDLEAAYMELVS